MTLFVSHPWNGDEGPVTDPGFVRSVSSRLEPIILCQLFYLVILHVHQPPFFFDDFKREYLRVSIEEFRRIDDVDFYFKNFGYLY